MAEENEPVVDLFGNIWEPPAETRGRKAHRRDPELAEKIVLLRATGSTQEEIERRVPLSVKTLRKYYSRELAGAPDLARAALVQVMWKKAMDGNVSAAKFIREELLRGVAFAPEAPAPEPALEPDPEKLGIKVQRDRAAQTAHEGTEWGDLIKH
jgi:uncharacterized protein Usg